MNTQILTCQDLIDLIDTWGFVPFFKNSIPGFSVEELTPKHLWFSDTQDGPWEWKGPAIVNSGCAYGKFFVGKAVFVSRDWVCHFANYRRDGYDFDARFDDGLAPLKDKWVFDLLNEHPSLLSKELKQLGNFGKEGKKGFDTIVTRLQMQGYITTANFEYMLDKKGCPYGWGVARYATFENLFGSDFTNNVYACTPAKSRRLIFDHLCALLPDADKKKIDKLIG